MGGLCLLEDDLLPGGQAHRALADDEVAVLDPGAVDRRLVEGNVHRDDHVLGDDGVAGGAKDGRLEFDDAHGMQAGVEEVFAVARRRHDGPAQGLDLAAQPAMRQVRAAGVLGVHLGPDRGELGLALPPEEDHAAG